MTSAFTLLFMGVLKGSGNEGQHFERGFYRHSWGPAVKTLISGQVKKQLLKLKAASGFSVLCLFVFAPEKVGVDAHLVALATVKVLFWFGFDFFFSKSDVISICS